MLGITLRIGGGEYLLDIPPPFSYPGGTNFPMKTFAMASTFLSTLVTSYAAKWLFKKGYIPARYDILKSNSSWKRPQKDAPVEEQYFQPVQT